MPARRVSRLFNDIPVLPRKELRTREDVEGIVWSAQPRIADFKIWPEAAQYILDTYNGSNRPVSKSRIQSYADTFKRGGWKLNRDVIKFTRSVAGLAPFLTDGQHRLMLTVLLGRPLMFTVLVGDRPNVESVQNQGRRGNSRQFYAQMAHRLAVSVNVNNSEAALLASIDKGMAETLARNPNIVPGLDPLEHNPHLDKTDNQEEWLAFHHEMAKRGLDYDSILRIFESSTIGLPKRSVGAALGLVLLANPHAGREVLDFFKDAIQGGGHCSKLGSELNIYLTRDGWPESKLFAKQRADNCLIASIAFWNAHAKGKKRIRYGIHAKGYQALIPQIERIKSDPQ